MGETSENLNLGAEGGKTTQAWNKIKAEQMGGRGNSDGWPLRRGCTGGNRNMTDKFGIGKSNQIWTGVKSYGSHDQLEGVQGTENQGGRMGT